MDFIQRPNGDRKHVLMEHPKSKFDVTVDLLQTLLS
jgi:hypothetical protein